jgi:hypothetical protein
MITTSPPPIPPSLPKHDGTNLNWLPIVAGLALLLALILSISIVSCDNSVVKSNDGDSSNQGEGTGAVESGITGANPDGLSSSMEESDGEESDGEESDGEESDGEESDGEESDGEESDGEEQQDMLSAPEDSTTIGQDDEPFVPEEQQAAEMTEEEKQKYRATPSEGGSKAVLNKNEDVGFFGLKSTGSHIGYVIDISGSMAGERLVRAKKELNIAISELKDAQIFSLFFFSDDLVCDRAFIAKKATPSNIKKLKRWLNQIGPLYGTNPLPAIERALSEQCDEIFLLSDGLFSVGTSDSILVKNSNNIKINTIGLDIQSESLKQIARENGGQYTEPSTKDDPFK